MPSDQRLLPIPPYEHPFAEVRQDDKGKLLALIITQPWHDYLVKLSELGRVAQDQDFLVARRGLHLRALAKLREQIEDLSAQTTTAESGLSLRTLTRHIVRLMSSIEDLMSLGAFTSRREPVNLDAEYTDATGDRSLGVAVQNESGTVRICQYILSEPP